MVFEHERDRSSQRATIVSITPRRGFAPKTLRKRVRQTETDTGRRGGVVGNDRSRMKELIRENRDPRRENEILRKAAPSLVQAMLDRRDALVYR